MMSSLEHPGQCKQGNAYEHNIGNDKFAVRSRHFRPRFLEWGVGVGEAESQARLPQSVLEKLLRRPRKNNVWN